MHFFANEAEDFNFWKNFNSLRGIRKKKKIKKRININDRKITKTLFATNFRFFFFFFSPVRL